MKEIVRGVDVAAPAAQVWAAVIDWERQGAWLPLTRVEVTEAAPGGGLGTRIVAWTGLGRLAVADRMTVTEWDPPHRARVTKTGRLMRGSAWFEVRELGPDRARLTWGEALEPPPGPVGRPVGAVLGLGTRAFFAVALRRFAGAVGRGDGATKDGATKDGATKDGATKGGAE